MKRGPGPGPYRSGGKPGLAVSAARAMGPFTTTVLSALGSASRRSVLRAARLAFFSEAAIFAILGARLIVFPGAAIPGCLGALVVLFAAGHGLAIFRFAAGLAVRRGVLSVAAGVVSVLVVTAGASGLLGIRIGRRRGLRFGVLLSNGRQPGGHRESKNNRNHLRFHFFHLVFLRFGTWETRPTRRATTIRADVGASQSRRTVARELLCGGGPEASSSRRG